LEGNCRGLIEALSRRLPGGTKENHETISQDSIKNVLDKIYTAIKAHMGLQISGYVQITAFNGNWAS
jgi:hypothetical protein